MIFLNKGAFKMTSYPLPLEKEEEMKYIKMASLGDEEAKDKLILHNLRLVVDIAKKYLSNKNNDLDDLFQIGCIGLTKAVNTYNIDKNIKLSTYCYKCIENEILMYIRKTQKDVNIISLDEPVKNFDNESISFKDLMRDDEIDIEEDYIVKELYEKIREKIENLNNRDKEIIKLYFGFYNGVIYKQEEIAKMLAISRVYVSVIIRELLKKLSNELKTELDYNSTTTFSQYKNIKTLKTIYKLLGCTETEFDNIYEEFTEKEKDLIYRRYGNDLENPKTDSSWSRKDNGIFYNNFIPKAKRLLAIKKRK